MMGARSLRLRGRLSGASAAALLGLSLACALAIGPAEADKVGVAAAVNPDAFSSLAGAPQSQLSIGKSIFYNERINTTGSGLVQVLLVDGSTFTVGPGSDLVIDKFVYDPKKGTGQIAASFSKGVMRFVGGKLSKNDGGVTLDTPAGALAIRGGIAYADFKSAKTYSILFVFGEYLKLGGSTLYQPGYGWFSNNGLFTTREFNATDLKTILAALTNGSPNPTPSDPPKPKTLTTILNTQSLNQLIADANTEQIVVQAQEAAANQEEQPQVCTENCGTPAGHRQGYAGGLYSQFSTNPYNNDEPVGVLANRNANDVDFDFTSNDQTFSALFKLRVGMPGDDQGGADINFGGPEYSFVNANGFAALSPPDGLTIYRDGQVPAELVGEPFAALASNGFFNGNNFGVNSFGPNETQNNGPPIIGQVDFCDTNCTFAEWGAFVVLASFEDPGDQPDYYQLNYNEYPDDITTVAVLGWWIAGDIPSVGQLPFTGIATYSGDATGTVATNIDGIDGLPVGDGWVSYAATGDLKMNWDFGTRSGDMTISEYDKPNFGPDGLTFSGPMCAPGVTSCGGGSGGEWSTPQGNHFGGPLSGELPDLGPEVDRNLNGFALGSFARGPSNYQNGLPITRSTPEGVIGNWGVGNDRYMASGIFAGARQ